MKPAKTILSQAHTSDPAATASGLREQAEATWDSMREYGIAPTPNNYKVWFAFCNEDKPELTRRIGSILQVGEIVMPDQLANLYSEFFDPPIDLNIIRSGSNTLQQIADDIVERASHDGSALTMFAQTMSALATELGPTPSTDVLRRAAAMVSDAGVQAGDRLQALEQLLTASIAKIADLRGRLVKAEQDATRDVLTGLYNRRMFESVLIRTAMQSAEEKSNLSVLLIDIDHFKRFNDTYGHAVGDNVLRLVGRTLLAHVKGRDTAARYGGEEFVILLPGASQSGAISLAEGIRQSLCARPVINRTSNQNLGLVTCSIGVAQFRHDEPAEGMVRRADQALYEAKRSGRNNVRGAT